MPAHDSKTFVTAVRSLERALHLNTTDAEVLAGVNGWRKKTKGALLEPVCRALWDGRTSEGMTIVEYREDWTARFAAQEQRIVDMTGEYITLKRQLDEANAALAASKREVSKLNKALGKQEPKGGLPAIIDPTKPLPEITAPERGNGKVGYSIKFPLGHTTPTMVEFGDAFWDNDGWNPVRQKVILKLLADGIPFEQVVTYFKCVERGNRKGFAYFEDADVSIKTRNAGEIYREFERASRALDCRLKVTMRCQRKVGRQSGKAAGQFAADAAFPGQILTLEPDRSIVEKPAVLLVAEEIVVAEAAAA